MNSQTTTLQINTKTLLLSMIGAMLVIPAMILLAIALLVPRMANADQSQTSNANPVYTVPAGYTLVPNTCAGGSASGAVSPVAAAVVTPWANYNNVTNQTQNKTTIKDSYNTRGDVTRNSNNNNGSYNDNFSRNNMFSNNSDDDVDVDIDVNSNNENSNNENSVVESERAANVISQIVASPNTDFNDNEVTIED